jgi:hypothetical protein
VRTHDRRLLNRNRKCPQATRPFEDLTPTFSLSTYQKCKTRRNDSAGAFLIETLLACWSSHRRAGPPLYIKKIAARTSTPDKAHTRVITSTKCIAKPALQKNHRDGDRDGDRHD